MSNADLETRVLASVAEAGQIDDSEQYCQQHAIDHNQLVGVLKSLQSSNMLVMQDITRAKWVLTAEAQAALDLGAAPEVAFFNAITQDNIPVDDVKVRLGAHAIATKHRRTPQATVPPVVAETGFRNAMANKWISLDKASGVPCVVRKVPSVEDTLVPQLWAIADGAQPTDAQLAYLQKRRKLISHTTWKAYVVTKGPRFALQRVKPATDLTEDLLVDDAWRGREFKAYNFHALGIPPTGGYLHPLLKVRTQFRKIFTQMGFEEMPTNQWVESSFWNFDVLFQPQQHPARDAHDTFFLTHPSSTPASNFPPDYLERVKQVHQHGGYGSTGYGYAWRTEEAEKNLLRTHTTAVSSRMLYRLAKQGFRPAKYFSIDRVFRNEAVDRTHLAEFHQVEGLVCGRGLSLGDLIGTLQTFFTRLGLPKLRFKPAYNPYTEPSMEIFSYSEELDKWMEVGNSGMFRPEMLRPMGLPEDVQVIAWGLSLERPTMILYGIDNIRDLFGHKVSLGMVKKNPVCRLGW